MLAIDVSTAERCQSLQRLRAHRAGRRDSTYLVHAHQASAGCHEAEVTGQGEDEAACKCCHVSSCEQEPRRLCAGSGVVLAGSKQSTHHVH